MQVGQSEAVLTTPSKTGTEKKRQKTQEVIPTPGPCAEERLQASSSPEIGVAGTVERAEVSRLLTPIMHPDWFRPNPSSTKTPSTSKVLSKVKRDAVTTPKNNKKVGVPVYEFTDEVSLQQEPPLQRMTLCFCNNHISSILYFNYFLGATSFGTKKIGTQSYSIFGPGQECWRR